MLGSETIRNRQYGADYQTSRKEMTRVLKPFDLQALSIFLCIKIALVTDAADAAGEFVSIGEGLDYLTVVTEKNGKYIRTVTLPDDHARELYMASMGVEDSGKAFATYQTYAWSLPMAYTEELTAKPKE